MARSLVKDGRGGEKSFYGVKKIPNAGIQFKKKRTKRKGGNRRKGSKSTLEGIHSSLIQTAGNTTTGVEKRTSIKSNLRLGLTRAKQSVSNSIVALK